MRNRSSAWLLSGNYLLRQGPVLITYYHGSQQVWLGLPFFALFGTTVEGLRLTHAMFALGILAALYAVLVRGACQALAGGPRRRGIGRRSRVLLRVSHSKLHHVGAHGVAVPLALRIAARTGLEWVPTKVARRERRVLRTRDIRLFHLHLLFSGDATRHLAVEPRHWGPAPRQLVEWVVAMVAVRTGCWRDLLPHRLWLEHPERGRLRRGLVAVPANAARIGRIQRTDSAFRPRRASGNDAGGGHKQLVPPHAHLRRIRAIAWIAAKDLVAGCRSRRTVAVRGGTRSFVGAVTDPDRIAAIVCPDRHDLRHAPPGTSLRSAAAHHLCGARRRNARPWRRVESAWPPGDGWRGADFRGNHRAQSCGPARRSAAPRANARRRSLFGRDQSVGHRSCRDESQAVHLFSRLGTVDAGCLSHRRHRRHGLC